MKGEKDAWRYRRRGPLLISCRRFHSTRQNAILHLHQLLVLVAASSLNMAKACSCTRQKGELNTLSFYTHERTVLLILGCRKKGWPDVMIKLLHCGLEVTGLCRKNSLSACRGRRKSKSDGIYSNEENLSKKEKLMRDGYSFYR